MKSGVSVPAVFGVSAGLVLCADGMGAELQVPSKAYPTIQSAIDAAADGDVILVAAGTYTESNLTIAASITLRGVDGPLSTILVSDPGSTLPAFQTDPGSGGRVDLEGFTVAGATGNRVMSGELSVRFCRFADCAPNGAISTVSGSALRIEESSFERCRSAGGGAVFVGRGTTSVVVSDCAFIANIANWTGGQSEGGAIHLTGAPSSIVRCTFIGNSADIGGAVCRWWNNPAVPLEDCAFTGNSSNWNCCVSCTNCVSAVASDWTVDCDEDGVPDRVAMLVWPQVDADGSGVPDLCECQGDLVSDGIVNAADASVLLNYWDTDGSGHLGVDLDGDGIVGAADLKVLLNNWGACAN
jgi:hypothetical protein